METTVKERLITYIKSKGLNQNTFEKAIGVSHGYINSISKGIGGERLERIKREFPDLNIMWLLTGEGEMLNARTSSNSQSGDGNTLINGNHNQVNLTEKHLSDYIEMLKDKIVELTKDRDFWRTKCLSDAEIAKRVEEDINEMDK